jgi:hypothetical protein
MIPLSGPVLNWDIQDLKTLQIRYYATCKCTHFHRWNDLSALKTEAVRSSETSDPTRPPQCHFPEDSILHSHWSENLKSYTFTEYQKTDFITFRNVAYLSLYRNSVLTDGFIVF